ncbi:unnamed protein product [Psylliodes chrysocephalus]|uniref:Uncharacterized protein n=1 Tax=Psylliodes chrysocephalus TaxID=3402493 RepID=A0A9P0CSD2_9CUCU|nr:unnamed protein product [Psylliodes chrysocephala]
MIKIFFFLLVLTTCSILVSLGQQNLFACPPSLCKLTSCSAPICFKDEILVPKGGICGCCDDCYTKLYAGQTCRYPFLGVGPFKGICVGGLICGNNNKCGN